MPDKRDLERSKESGRILDRVARESDLVGSSALARTAERMRDHFAANDADRTDWAELWGARLGRILALIAFVALAIWLLLFLADGK